MGADAFIVKPAKPDEFITKVETILESGRRGRQETPNKPKGSEQTILKNYNEVLINKLEHKMQVLEKANRELENEMAARRQAEISLRENEERYRLLFENSMVGVLLTEPDGRILRANPTACSIFARTEDELKLLGRNSVLDKDDPKLISALQERARTGYYHGELTATRSDGTPFPCEISSAVFKDTEGRLKTSMVIRDLTEQKLFEAKINADIKEKEIMLAEIHHRVKNNMQVIISLINLQLVQNSKAMTAGQSAETAAKLQNRIRSMALVHEMLYESKNFSRINLGEYIRKLAMLSVTTYCTAAHPIATDISSPDEYADIVLAVPLGMIINEVLTNSLKYAFPASRAGEIRITLDTCDDDQCQLTIRDNGIGLPEDFDINSTPTIGLNLISILCKQINGTMDMHNDHGMYFSIRFRNHRDKR